MRRKDREIVEIEKIEAVIAEADCCHLGFYDGGEVYIVPLSFGYQRDGGQSVFYFHSAKEGRKIDLIKTSPRVGFELDTHYKINTGETACAYSARFRSIIGTGTVTMIDSPDEKEKALHALMLHTTRKDGWIFTDQMAAAVGVFKLEVEKMSCKEHL